jgi:hypothetical protein
MVKPANCGVCGEKDESKFYYGQKKLCKTCYAKKINKDYVSKKAKLSDVIETFNQKFNEYEARIVSLETANSDVIETLKVADNKILELEEQIKTLTLQKTVPRARSPSPKPKSRSPSPKPKSRSPSPKPKSRSPSPSPARARSVSPRRASSPKITNSIPEFPILEAPAPKRYSCKELDSMEIKAKTYKVKEVAKELKIFASINGRVKPTDELRAEVLKKIEKLRSD